MFTLVVRSKRDADAVRAMVSRFYPAWGVDVATMHGARSEEAMARELEDIVRPDRFYIVLLGREDARNARRLEEILPANAVAHVVPKARVRNARMEQLYVETLRARARLRLAAGWAPGAYRLEWGAVAPLEAYEVDVSHDNFIGLGRFADHVSALVGGAVGRNPLVLRLHGGRHHVYNGPRVRAVLEVDDLGIRPRAELVEDAEPLDVDISRLVEENRAVLERLSEASRGFLRSLGEFDRVIVPWSGGKDSTAALIAAIEAFGRRRVTAVFGDTGTEFPSTLRYVEETAKALGVELEVAYAGLDKALAEGAPMPSHENRWCTGRKIEAIEAKIAELAEGRTLVVIGDRDAESPRRSDRPPIREGPAGTLVATPIRLWGGAHVQAYILSRGLRLNPMYEAGFYRIGCYMCPALRNWEIHVMSREREALRLLGSRIYRRFLHQRLFHRPREARDAMH